MEWNRPFMRLETAGLLYMDNGGGIMTVPVKPRWDGNDRPRGIMHLNVVMSCSVCHCLNSEL